METIMIVLPETEQFYRIMAIDNGSNTLGLSICDLDLESGLLYVVHSATITASKTTRRYGAIEDSHGGRFARFEVLRDFVAETLEDYYPDNVSVESPFCSRFHVESFAVLRETMLVIRQAVIDFYVHLDLRLVTPTEAKRAVKVAKVKKKRGVKVDNKALARDAVLALTDVVYLNDIDKFTLDEHCIDSIAVAKFEAGRVLDAIHLGGVRYANKRTAETNP